jgi:protein-S-isoprenylcysteine O-methyltransferase Ste14
MAIGFSAPWMVLGLLRDERFAASRGYLLWNVLGIVDLIVAVSMGTICSGFMPGLTGTITTSAMGRLPLVLIPAYLVPLFIMLHFTGLAQARRLKGGYATNREIQAQAGEASIDSPQVIVFPPALLLATLSLSILLNAAWPWHVSNLAWVKGVGGVLFLCGGALAAWGRRTMTRAGTNVPPYKPALVIVTDGPFRLTRNPLYLGGTAAYLGVSLGFNLGWGLIFLVPMLVVLNYGIVRREERYLERKFGGTYLAYKARVPRWLYGRP